MMLPGLLLMYLQNSHILSTSTFAYTARAETLRLQPISSKHDAPGVAPDVATKLTHHLHEHICLHRPRGDQCMMLPSPRAHLPSCS